MNTPFQFTQAPGVPRPGKENQDESADARVAELRTRISALNHSVEKSKRVTVGQLEVLLASAARNTEEYTGDHTALGLAAGANELEAGLLSLGLCGSSFEGRFQAKLGLIAEDFRVGAQDLRAEHRGLVSQFAKLGTDRLFALGVKLNGNTKDFNDRLNARVLDVEETIEQTRAKVARENRAREEAAESLEGRVASELSQLTEGLAVERRATEDFGARARGLLEALHEDFGRKLEQERKDRERSHNNFLQLFEEACTRVERNFY